ncbi:MAG TPA: hypothetical protein VHR42_02335 [Clostridia bacterium]|nr:hypothetical protein [Clostridia bacterium]
MKKTMIIICTILMALSLTACGVNGAQQAPQTSQNGQASAKTAGSENLLSAGYADIMKSGKFLIRYKASTTVENVMVDAEITTATDGEAVATIMKTKETTSHSIIKGNAIYMLDDTNKTYSKMNVSQEEKSAKTGDLTDTGNLAYVGKGTGAVNGKNLPYEEYKAGDETLRFFMNGKNLYAIRSKTKDGELTMVVLELTGKIPAETLSIPADFKEGTVMSIPSGIDMAGQQMDTEEAQNQ